jgi:manganese/zinc/iron transport system substrate-binding protein
MELKHLILPAIIATLSSCNPNSNSSDDSRPLVVTTTTMVTDLVSVIGGENIRIVGLMGPGVDPHSYVPRIGDTRLLDQADVVFYNGLHLEGRFQSTLEALAQRGKKSVAVTNSIPIDRLLAPEEDFVGTYDPHVWGDPRLWAETIRSVVDTLTEILPENAEEFKSRGDAYAAELQATHELAVKLLSSIPSQNRILVTSHDAFFYFGRAYEFNVSGLQGVSTASEAGIRDRTELVEYLRKLNVKTVFPETSVSDKGLAAVADEAGVQLSKSELFSDALGKPGDTYEFNQITYDRGTYLGMHVHNVTTITQGLAP